MGAKIVSPDYAALTSLYQDISGNRYCVYKPESFPSGIIKDKYVAKCSSLMAGTSGAWLIVIPHRVEQSNKKTMIVTDPLIILWNLTTRSPCPSSIIKYHSHAPWNHSSIETEAITNPQALVELKTKALEMGGPIDALPAKYKHLFNDMVELSNAKIFMPLKKD